MSTEDFVRRLIGPSKLNQPPGPPERLRACAWARVSTGEQEERGLSIPEQFREIKCFAEKRGIDILREFYEAASAFRHQERLVVFLRMVDWVRTKREIDIILVHDYSRFGRDGDAVKSTIRELLKIGVRVPLSRIGQCTNGRTTASCI
jgi:site-specific DNA recombinase